MFDCRISIPVNAPLSEELHQGASLLEQAKRRDEPLQAAASSGEFAT